MKIVPTIGFGLSQTGDVPAPQIFSDHDWLMNTAAISPLITLDDLSRTTYRLSAASSAQAIRDAAGIPADQVAGLQTGETAGLSDPGALTFQSNILDIDNTTEAAAESVSGDGSAGAPYLVRDRDVNVGSGVAQAVRIQGSHYITFENCRFAGGTARTFIALAFSGTARFVSCEFYNDQVTASTFDLNSGGGNYIFENCLFSGVADGAGIVVTSASSVSLTNTRIDASQSDWTSVDSFLLCNTNACQVTAQHIEADCSASASIPYALFRLDAAADNCSFQNMYVTGFKKIITDINPAGSTTGNLRVKNNITVRYVHGDLLEQEHIETIYTDNLLVEYCHFTHGTNANGFRMMLLTADFTTSGVFNDNTTIRYCRFRSDSPDDIAANEIITYDIGRNIHIHHCWCEAAPEDYIEPRFPVGPANIHDIVGDNIVGAIVNAWQSFTFATWTSVDTNEPANAGDDSGLYVRRIFGDAGRHGIAMEGTKDGVIHDIYVVQNALSAADVNWHSVQIKDRDLIGGNTNILRDWFIAGPLTLPADREGVQAVDYSVTDTSHEARYFDNQSGTGSLTIQDP